MFLNKDSYNFDLYPLFTGIQTVNPPQSDTISRHSDLNYSEKTPPDLEQITRTLYDISNAVSTTFNLDELYQSIHRSLKNIINVFSDPRLIKPLNWSDFYTLYQ